MQLVSQVEKEAKKIVKVPKITQAELNKATEMLLDDLNAEMLPMATMCDDIVKKVVSSEAAENYKITSTKLAEQKKSKPTFS